MMALARRWPASFSSLLARLKSTATRLGFGWGHNLRLGDTLTGWVTARCACRSTAEPIEISLGLNDKKPASLPGDPPRRPRWQGGAATAASSSSIP
jgi:hypothetical protein